MVDSFRATSFVQTGVVGVVGGATVVIDPLDEVVVEPFLAEPFGAEALADLGADAFGDFGAGAETFVGFGAFAFDFGG